MTNQQHPITPPPELVRQWRKSAPADAAANNAYERHIATQAARWGADQELEACCKQVAEWQEHWECKDERLHAARRPKPPSLKEQALEELESIMDELHEATDSAFTASAIRRALEQLDD